MAAAVATESGRAFTGGGVVSFEQFGALDAQAPVVDRVELLRRSPTGEN